MLGGACSAWARSSMGGVPMNDTGSLGASTASWVESYRSFVSYWLLNYLGSSSESSSDLTFSIYQLQDLFC